MKIENLYPSGEIPCPGDIVMVKAEYRNLKFFKSCCLHQTYEELANRNFTFTVFQIYEGPIKNSQGQDMCIGTKHSHGYIMYMPSFCFDLIARGVLYTKASNED